MSKTNNIITFTITDNLYNKLKRRFTEYKQKVNHYYKLDDLIYCLLLRYHTLNSLGHQWGIPTNIKDQFTDNLHINFECFASSLNHYYKYYCSIFYDIEKYFMSIGYFQNVNYIKGFFMANPPYDIDLLHNMVNKFITSLDKSRENLSFIFGLPTWKIDETYKLPLTVKNNKYCIYQIVFKDYQLLWYDFIKEDFHRIPSSTRSVISNNIDKTDNTIDKIIQNWIKYSKK